jgi:hypothetical protein
MHVRRQTLFSIVIGAILAACGPASVPCGLFTFWGVPTTSRGISDSVAFQFNPATCGAPACNTNAIAYVQIVRIVDLNTGDFLAPNTDQANRIVTGRADAAMNGWAVDRLSGRVWGYYGRNNDGTFAGTLTPGSNVVVAKLRDQPSGWPDRSWFDAVSVPVCIDAGSTCVNQLLGYYYWLFTVGAGGSVGTPFSEIGRQWHRDAVDQSVLEWNNDAAALGKNAFPAFTRMRP